MSEILHSMPPTNPLERVSIWPSGARTKTTPPPGRALDRWPCLSSARRYSLLNPKTAQIVPGRDGLRCFFESRVPLPGCRVDIPLGLPGQGTQVVVSGRDAARAALAAVRKDQLRAGARFRRWPSCGRDSPGAGVDGPRGRGHERDAGGAHTNRVRDFLRRETRRHTWDTQSPFCSLTSITIMFVALY